MAKSFNGTTSSLYTLIGAIPTAGATAWTVAAIARRAGQTGTQMLAGGDGQFNSNWGLRFNGTGMESHITAAFQAVAGITFGTADNWALVICGKAVGTTTPRGSKYVYDTNTWTHANAAATQGNANQTTVGFEIGSRETEAADFWNGDIAVVGVWNRLLTDAERETLAFSLVDWIATVPVGLWVLDQADTSQTVPDLSGGGAQQTTGTANLTVAASSVPGFTYGADLFEVLSTAAVAAADIPYSPQRMLQGRDYGEAYWLQKDRRDANLVGGPQLGSPLDSAWQSGAQYWHLYNDGNNAATATLVQRRYGSDVTLLADTSADPLMLSDARTRELAAAAFMDRRQVPQQRERESDPNLLGTALLEDPLLSGGSIDQRINVPATHADRRLVPLQRTAITGPDVVVVAVPGPIPVLPWRRDPIALQQRLLESPPDLLGTALLEDALLGAAETVKRTNVPATHVDRREVPQYTLRESSYGLLDTGLLEIPAGVPGLAVSVAVTHLRPGWLRQRLTQADQSAGPDFDPTQGGYLSVRWRRDPYPPTQRSYQTPGLFDLDPTLAGYGTAWRWRRDPYPLTQRLILVDQSAAPAAPDLDPTQAGYDLPPWRRDPYPPQQRPYVSPYGLLDSALLEDVLLGGATTWWRHIPATHADRREVPQQRQAWADTAAPPVPADPTLLGWLVNWLADNRAATHVDRRLVPAQRPYISDPSTYPTVAPADPLALAWGVGGPLWHLYNDSALRDRRGYPQQRSYWIEIPAETDPVLVGWLPTRIARNVAAFSSRRLVPQQPKRESDPNLLQAALLEDALLGGADDLVRHRAWYVDRRLYPQQRPVFGILGSLADPLLIVGGDWRRVLTPATHAPRWVLRPWWQTQQFQGGALVLFQGVIVGGVLAGPGATGATRSGPGATGAAGTGSGMTGGFKAGPGETGQERDGTDLTGGSR